ncbi:uncharacterized protein N7511_008276 [Penicillium nucicola]|uniref:uncharacterized protein n=1 Tax=Penicillium nucicola TaxID=1850975 RepID=UPI0025458457|nr:uncharacterized protein N7511_008276 [Penicillium nucicola]KAJ5754123.1 hypothetical protein N7511_008276 [Penicillium nucicola]
MPRPRRPGAPEPKRRSRKGCWPCKARKVKCGEEKPACLNCQRQGESCDYSVRLNWGGRTKRASIDSPNSQSSGYGGVVFGISDSFSINNMSPGSVSTPSSVPAPTSNNSGDGFINSHPMDLTSPGAISPTTPAPGIFESPRPGSESEGVTSPNQLDIQFASGWGEHSSQLGTSAASGVLSQYPFGQQNFDGLSFPASADHGSGLRSLSAFAFHTSPVSQPVSFLRHSVDVSNHQPDTFMFHNHDQEKLIQGGQESIDEHDANLTGNKHGGSSHSPRENGGLSSLLVDSHKVAIAGSNAASSPRLGEAPMTTGSAHDYHDELGGDNQTIESAHANEQASRDTTMAQNKWQTYLNSVTDNYGLDSGRPDQDLMFNNDHAAIDINYALDLISSRWQDQEFNKASPPQPTVDSQTQFCSGYYASSVPINIPRYLSPLPSSLLENPINLMYFHHFLNHTARMLVPHSCDNNPFISVLPSTYSASHRARYLGHPEPANRIAHWVSKVFPTLRVALESPNEDITDSHLAAAIMLLSLKIVSPGTFEVPITWKSHLKLARDLFLARSERMAQPGNRIGAFFARWLGYLDTMGALSCRQAGPPLMIYNSILTACSPDDHDDFSVDCFTGFTPRTGVFLIRLARLVQECDNQRFNEMGHFQHDWHASADVVLEAQAVLGEIDGLSEHAHTDLDHHHGIESADMMAIEEAFRFAGLLHLHRRVLGSPPDSFPVKEVLRKLIDALSRMRPGAATEVCSLFPLFTAGCESRDAPQRSKLLDRFFVLESSGMKQIQNARQLMQHCWERKLPWVALAGGQFLG